MEAHAAQEEKHEQGKRRAKLEAGFAEVAVASVCSCICKQLNWKMSDDSKLMPTCCWQCLYITYTLTMCILTTPFECLLWTA